MLDSFLFALIKIITITVCIFITYLITCFLYAGCVVGNICKHPASWSWIRSPHWGGILNPGCSGPHTETPVGSTRKY